MIEKILNEWYKRGKKEGESLRDSISSLIKRYLDYIEFDLPLARGINHKEEVVKLNRERIDAEPDYGKYPELKGYKECYVNKQNGFMEGARCTEEEMALYFNFHWYVTRRLYTRFIGRLPSDTITGGCTSVYFKHSEEGPLMGRNTDDPPYEGFSPSVPLFNFPARKHMLMGSSSSALLCDDEPGEIFPGNPFDVLPEDIEDDVKLLVEFLERYNEFWGPGCHLFVDRKMDSVVIEKSNTKMGVRYPVNGASCITAGYYLVPEMKEWKIKKDKLSLEKRGWTEDSNDWIYWEGGRLRYEKLMKLVEEEAKRGPSLQGVVDIMHNHEEPNICAYKQELTGSWTLLSWAMVLEGETRRLLFWRIEDGKPVYELKPYLVAGYGVRIREEWKKNSRLVTDNEKRDDKIPSFGVIE